MNNNIVISTPPHVKTKRTTKGIMLDVLIALAPAAIAGIVFFGFYSLLIMCVSVASAVLTEFVYYFIANGGFKNKCKDAGAVCMNWVKQFDYTSIITGLILALILPPNAIWYEVIIGNVLAIALVKMLFGGTGKNLFNPAAMGRVIMFISFAISTFTVCKIDAVIDGCTLEAGATDLTGALLLVPADGAVAPTGHSLLDLFLGTGLSGCIGETCKLAIFAGYIYLVVRKVIKWWQPLLYVLVTGITGVCLMGFDFSFFLPSILSGGLLFGAVFMATDYVTSPKGTYGQIVYYVLLGLLTAILRHLTKIEVVSFVIILVNCFVPLIDRYIVRKPFGYKHEKKNKEAK